MVRQYHFNHRRSWVWRPSWDWGTSTMSIQKDGCVVCDLCTFKYNTSQWRGVAWPYLHHQKTMSILIAIRRRWDDSMLLCAVLNESSYNHECWYLRCTLWLNYIPSDNVAARVLNTFQNVSLYFDVYLTQEEKTFILSTTPRYVNATWIIVEVEWRDNLGVREHLRDAY